MSEQEEACHGSRVQRPGTESQRLLMQMTDAKVITARRRQTVEWLFMDLFGRDRRALYASGEYPAFASEVEVWSV